MPSRQPHNRRRLLPPVSDSHAHSELVRRPGGFIKVPRKLTPPPPPIGGMPRLTKLLLNVNIQGSLGPVQVVMSPENTVNDLIKAALEIHVKEMRQPLVNETNPWRFELHYSQFSLQSLKAEDELIKLGSRNFYLCRKPLGSGGGSLCPGEAEKVAQFSFPFTCFMDFLL